MKLYSNLYGYLVVFIYLSFVFDSLLKVNIGIKIHLGILLILILNTIFFFLEGYRNKITLLKTDQWLILFSIYALVSGLLNVGLSSLFIFFYLFLALNVYFFIKRNIQFLTRDVFFYSQLALIITGLVQFLLVIFFEYQLNFLDTEHYNKGSSVSYRLRGFFVEPNWFAIAFTFNTFLLIKNDILYFIRKHYILSVFTLIVLIVNGSFGTLAVLILTYGYKYFKKNIVIGLFLGLLGGVGFYLILQQRSDFKKDKKGIEIFNYYSRTEPFNRVNSYFDEKPIYKKIFGEGFGSWGTIAITNNLSVLNYEIRKDARDSSELHVFLFELGLIGTLLFFLDIYFLYRRNLKANFYINGAIMLFVVSFLLYPIFKFLMYMVYYFVIRVLVIRNRKDFINNTRING